MIVVDDVAKLLREFQPEGDSEAAESRDLTLELLGWAPEPFSREFFTPGHITGTGVVLSPKRKRVLLVHHARLHRWLLPGGHVEPVDESIAHTAAREVMEETGVQLSTHPAVLVGVDIHPIPASLREPLHLHHDLIFAFQAESKLCHISAEIRKLTWCRLDQFDNYSLPLGIRNSVRRAVRHPSPLNA